MGIPTETVYGLGADGLNPAAVAKIFVAKGRPQDNPLILHVPDDSWLTRYCRDIPEVAYTLTRRFWPGPLTLILKRKPSVPDVVTAGLDTVGMRCPDCAITRKIIALADTPVAAPSGNTSGKPSPTTAEAMGEDMDGKVDAIVDGGPCRVGLESTILDLTVTPPRLLRPGGVTVEELEELLGEIAIDPAVTRLLDSGEQPKAPGMKYRHYAPKAPVTVVNGDPEKTARYIQAHLFPTQGPPSAHPSPTGCPPKAHPKPTVGVVCFEDYVNLFPGVPVQSLGPKDDPKTQAHRLFETLRAFDHLEVSEIFAQSTTDTGLGLAITNRLNKAAGFHIIELKGNEI